MDVFGPDYFRRAIGVESVSYEDEEGLHVCYSGGVTGNRCGNVEDVDVEVDAEGVTLFNQRRICDLPDDSGEDGDSGAPVYEQVGPRDARAVGILSGESNGCGFGGFGTGLWYSHVGIAAGHLNVWVCTSRRARCGR